MANVRITTGSVETLQTEPLIDRWTGVLRVGMHSIKAKIRRISDDFHLDWADMTFKTPGSPVDLLKTLTEVSMAYFPGEYSTTFDTSSVTNPTADDTYEVTVVDDTADSDIGNLPQVGEIKVGQFVDELLARTDSYQVYQNYAFDFVNNILTGIVWVEHKNAIVTTASMVVVELFDANGTLLFPALIDSSPDAQGVFKVTRGNPPGIVANAHFYARATMTIPGVGTTQSAKGLFTV
jgi:hypothetical protein